MKFRFLLTGLTAFLIGFAVTTTSWAQNTYERLSVVEEFTSATCGPCVAASTALKQVIDLAQNHVVSIRFHMNWPAPGDPWNLENAQDNDARRGYYGVSGIPNGQVNGASVNITDPNAILAKVVADNALLAPLKIEVSQVKNGIKYDVKVKVTTNIALTNHKLLVGVVSRYSPYPGLASSLPGSNGEEEFFDAMNKMLSGGLGTSMNMTAGSEQTFEFSYTKGTGNTWPVQQQYVIAYVQDATSKTVLNAGTDLKIIRAKADVVGAKWETIDKGGQGQKTIRITNTGDKELVCQLEIDNADNLSQAGWTASLTSNEAVIPANGSVDVKINNTATTRAFFAAISVNITPVATNGVPEATNLTCGYLTNGSRVGVFYGATSGAPGNAIPALASTHGQDVVYVPLNTEILSAFPVSTSYDAIILPCGFDGRFAIINLVPLAEEMLNAKKGVWMSAPVGLAVALNEQNQQFAGYPEAKAFFENFGLAVSSTKDRNDGQYYTTFQLAGVSKDPIGDLWAGTANNGSQNWPFFIQSQDIISLQSGTCKSFVFADGNSTNISGVRYEDPASAKRFVYTSFGPEHIGTESQRNALVQRVLDYILPSKQSTAPEITATPDKVSFGMVDVASSLDKVVSISNTGKSDLEINSIKINGLDASSFSIIEGALGTGEKATVAPGGKYAVKVRFQPMSEKAGFAATLMIGGNAPTKSVQLSGSSRPSSVATDVVSETGAIGLRLVGKNPVMDNTTIELKSISAVTVTVVDNTGSTVATLFSGQPTGMQLVNLNASVLASGTYNVVATNGSEHAVLSIVVAR